MDGYLDRHGYIATYTYTKLNRYIALQCIALGRVTLNDMTSHYSQVHCITCLHTCTIMPIYSMYIHMYVRMYVYMYMYMYVYVYVYVYMYMYIHMYMYMYMYVYIYMHMYVHVY